MRRFSILASAFSLLSLATACTPSAIDALDISMVAEREAAVVNGRLASGAEIFGTVSLASNLNSFCTGTLIAPRVVVTAAHCLEGETPASLQIVAGALNIGAANANQVYAVDTLLTHNNYTPFGPTDNEGVGTTNDIALVITEEPITTVAVMPIPSAQSVDANMDNGAEVTVTGYGVTSPQSATGTLYIGEVAYDYRTGGEFLAGLNQTTDSCYGDSGGPVYVEDITGSTFVIGVVSRGANSASANCGGGGIYGFLPHYADWIENNAGGLFDADSVGSVGAVADHDDGGNTPPGGDGQCAGACGGQSPDGCWCDDTCATQGDCCADYAETCTDVGDPEQPDDGVWTCDPTWLGDGECDCGCGAMDSDCADNDIALCVYSNCDGDEDVNATDIRLCSDAVVVEPEPAPGEPEPAPGEPEPAPGEPEPSEPEPSPGEPEPAAPEGWSCADKLYDDAVCDCGCGIRDRDCTTNNVGACEREHCGEGGNIDPDALAECVENTDDPTPLPGSEGDIEVRDIGIEGGNGTNDGQPGVVGGCCAAGSARPGPAVPGVLSALGLMALAVRRRQRARA